MITSESLYDLSDRLANLADDWETIADDHDAASWAGGLLDAISVCHMQTGKGARKVEKALGKLLEDRTIDIDTPGVLFNKIQENISCLVDSDFCKEKKLEYLQSISRQVINQLNQTIPQTKTDDEWPRYFMHTYPEYADWMLEFHSDDKVFRYNFPDHSREEVAVEWNVVQSSVEEGFYVELTEDWAKNMIRNNGFYNNKPEMDTGDAMDLVAHANGLAHTAMSACDSIVGMDGPTKDEKIDMLRQIELVANGHGCNLIQEKEKV